MISFLQPLALVALAAAAIPPLLHLLGRRQPRTVTFPAVRYLVATELEHSRRLRLRHLLLMLLRTAVIVLLVLAAAQPVTRAPVGRGHPPTAMAIIVDNSMSSAAVTADGQALDALIARARSTLERLTADDRLWLVLADGVPRRSTPMDAAGVLDSLTPWPVRLDVAAAARAAAATVSREDRAVAEVVVFTDAQRTAFTAGEAVKVRTLIWRSPPPPPNRAIDSAFATPRVWRNGGSVVVVLGGTGDDPAAVRAVLGAREVARGLAAPGERVVLRTRAPGTGWSAARVELDPDELRLDDRWWLAVHAAEPAAVSVADGAGPFVRDAVQVLIQGGRLRDGREVTIASAVSPGALVLVPPADPALVGAANRALAARGVGWRFGERLDGEWTVTGDVEPAVGATVRRRHRLDGAGRVLARAGGEPWLVQSGDVVVIASRLETGWTDLPVTARFVPFLDELANHVATRPAWILRAPPGGAVRLPEGIEAVHVGETVAAAPADRRFAAPVTPGVYFFTAGGDTVGALEVNHDRRESRLEQADGNLVQATLGSAAALVDDATLDRELFAGARRANLAGMLLGGALLAALAELWLGARRAPAREPA